MVFYVTPQTACITGCIATLIAFVWLFSSVYFQLGPQILHFCRCIVTLTAFILLIFTVWQQMFFQVFCTRWWIVTLVAFVWLISQIHITMYPQVGAINNCWEIADWSLFNNCLWKCCPALNSCLVENLESKTFSQRQKPMLSCRQYHPMLYFGRKSLQFYATIFTCRIVDMSLDILVLSG